MPCPGKAISRSTLRRDITLIHLASSTFALLFCSNMSILIEALGLPCSIVSAAITDAIKESHDDWQALCFAVFVLFWVGNSFVVGFLLSRLVFLIERMFARNRPPVQSDDSQ